MNKQETFDKVATHLLTQNDRAVKSYTSSNGIPTPSCMYRAPDGKTCAVGCLIPDNLYDADFEDHDVSEIFDNYSALSDYLTMDDMTSSESHIFYQELQAIHDREEPKNWRNALEVLAVQEKLNDFAITL